MKGLKLLSSLLLVSSISATALPTKDESIGDTSRWLLAKSVRAYANADNNLALKFAKYSCGLGNRDACLFAAIITVNQMEHNSASVLTPSGTSQLLNVIHYELKSCKLGNPYACYSFAGEMRRLGKGDTIKAARKFVDDPTYQNDFAKGYIKSCKAKGETHCTEKAATTLANLVTLSHIIVTNQNTIKDYQQLACKKLKNYTITPLTDAPSKDIQYYNQFVALMHHYTERLKHFCGVQR